MLFGKKKELQEKPKGTREWTQQLRRLYNAYVKKEMLAGRDPIDRDKWLQIYGR